MYSKENPPQTGQVVKVELRALTKNGSTQVGYYRGNTDTHFLLLICRQVVQS